MNYIVLDMEWNQSYPNTGEDKRKKKPANEIIEIGAVKLNEKKQCLATYKRLIKPMFIKKLNSHVKKLTGITAQMLSQGGYFPDIIEEFKQWCGEGRVILTWGYDDIPMLISCLEMYSLDSSWVGEWYNLQVIFNAQTDSGSNQKSLKSAMEYFQLTLDTAHPWHDALNDAEYTAMICQRLDLERGVEEYGENSRSMSPSAAVIASLKEVSRSRWRCSAVNGRSRCPEAFNDNPCPVCRAPMVRGGWAQQGKGKMITVAECKTHGRFFIQIRLTKQNDGGKFARKIVYESSKEAESFYMKKIKKTDMPKA